MQVPCHQTEYSKRLSVAAASGTTTAMSPDAIRVLRGARTRAAFGQAIGVTALTVYRWELPEDAPEARRPRGKKLQALLALQAREGEGAAFATVTPASASASPVRSSAVRSSAVPSSAIPSEDEPAWQLDRARLLPELHELDEGQVGSTERRALQLLGHGALSSAAGRALASAVSIECQLLGRGAIDAALTTLPVLLAGAERGEYPPEVAARLHTVSALVCAYGPAEFRSALRVRSHAGHADELDPSGSLRVRGACASLVAAAEEEDPAVLAHLCDAAAATFDGVGRPLERCLVADALAVAHQALGRVAAARRAEETALELATTLGIGVVCKRVHLRRALRARLDALTPELARQAIAAARQAALDEYETSQLIGAEVEALVRGGALDQALERIARLEQELAGAIHGHYGWLVPVCEALRLKGARQRLDSLVALLPASGDGLRDRAARAYAEAAALLCDQQAAAVEAATRAADLAENVADPQLQLDARVLALRAAVARGKAQARQQLQLLQQLLARCPSAWHDAVARHHEGVLALDERRVVQARGHLEVALATFQLTGDVVLAAQARGALATAELAAGERGAVARLRQSVAELDELGVARRKRPIEKLSTRSGASDKGKPSAGPVARVAACLERFSARGLSPQLVLRELERAARDLLGEGKAASSIAVEPATGLQRASGRFDVSDGVGGKYQLAFRGTLDGEEQARLQALSVVGSLALEVATLRGVDTAPPEPVVDGVELPTLVAVSPSMRVLRDQVVKLRRSKATVLLHGESGSGKEVVARAVHDASARSDKPYVAFNCAALPRELFEGQLFGYRKGAFTGANANHAGVIREADGGTLFLDEIGELPLDVQPKLLRFLENGEILPLGESKSLRVDVRIVAATHRDLQAMASSGKFREDLYYRLNVVRLQIPPLRERPDDVSALSRRFVEQLTPAGTAPPRLGPEALAALRQHPLPGNARELRNLLERALAFEPLPPVLQPRHLGLE